MSYGYKEQTLKEDVPNNLSGILDLNTYSTHKSKARAYVYDCRNYIELSSLEKKKKNTAWST